MSAALLRELLIKDTKCLVRNGYQIVAVLGFAVIVVVLSSFGFRDAILAGSDVRRISTGVIWLLFLFNGVICLNQSFGKERERSALLGLVISGVEPALISLSKILVNFVFLFLVQAVALFVYALLFGEALFATLPGLLGITALVGIGFVAIGTLLACAAAGMGEREVLLPLVLFPISIPLLAAAVRVSEQYLQYGEIGFSSFAFTLICVYGLIGLTLSLVLFEFVVRD